MVRSVAFLVVGLAGLMLLPVVLRQPFGLDVAIECAVIATALVIALTETMRPGAAARPLPARRGPG